MESSESHVGTVFRKYVESFSPPLLKLPFSVKQLPDLYPVSTRHTYSHTLGCVLSTAARVIFLLKILQRPHFTLKKSQVLTEVYKALQDLHHHPPCHLPSSLLLGFLFFKKNYLIYLFGWLQRAESSFLTRSRALGVHSLSQDFQGSPILGLLDAPPQGFYPGCSLFLMCFSPPYPHGDSLTF